MAALQFVQGKEVYRIRDAISEADEFHLALCMLPVGGKCQDKRQGRAFRLGGAVGQGNTSKIFGSSVGHIVG